MPLSSSPCHYPPPHVLISSSLSHCFSMPLSFPSSPYPSHASSPQITLQNTTILARLTPPSPNLCTFVDHTNMTSSLRLEQVCVCALCGVCNSSKSFKSLHIIPGPQSLYGRALLLCPIHVTCMCACYMYVCMLHVCVHVTCMCACYMCVCMLHVCVHVTCMCACYMYVCMLHICVHVTCMCACYMILNIICVMFAVCVIEGQSLEGQRLRYVCVVVCLYHTSSPIPSSCRIALILIKCTLPYQIFASHYLRGIPR